MLSWFLYDQPNSERQTILVPTKLCHIPVSKLLVNAEEETEDEELAMPVYKPDSGEDDFLTLLHVALQLRSDLLDQPVYKGLSIDEDDVLSCVPKKVYMFLQLLLGGQTILEPQNADEDGNDQWQI